MAHKTRSQGLSSTPSRLKILPDEDILGAKLPSKRQVLSHFWHRHRSCGKTLGESASLTLTKVKSFWERAHISVKKDCRSKEQILCLYKEWQNLQKNFKTAQTSCRKKEDKFADELDDLFDIAHGDAVKLIKDEEDGQFLLLQRKKGREGSMASLDRKLAQKTMRRLIVFATFFIILPRFPFFTVQLSFVL